MGRGMDWVNFTGTLQVFLNLKCMPWVHLGDQGMFEGIRLTWNQITLLTSILWTHWICSYGRLQLGRWWAECSRS
jgi:hypothetical protein